MPNRSRKGEVSSPARVVAPTRVNGARSSLIDLAPGPSPIMRSSCESSMAGYSTSSTTAESRWISSTNSTSRGSRLVSNAARSPGRSSTGPEVWRRFTPNSWAMMWASVVLPRPGGPKISTWSRASARFLAAVMKMSICSRTAGWPTYSARVRGRMARSTASSSALPWLVTRRSSVAMAASPRAQRALQRAAYEFFAGEAGLLDGLQHVARFLGLVAQGHERAQRLVPRMGHDAGQGRGRAGIVQTVAHLHHQPLGGLLAYARQPGERGCVVLAHAAHETIHA